jgi:hypothetical protein
MNYLLKSSCFTDAKLLINSCVDGHWYLLQTDTFKGNTYKVYNCDTFGNRESRFYQDSTLSMDADARNSEGEK